MGSVVYRYKYSTLSQGVNRKSQSWLSLSRVPAVPLRARICDPHNRGIEPPSLLGLQPDLNRTQTLDNHSQVDGEALLGN